MFTSIQLKLITGLTFYMHGDMAFNLTGVE